MNLCGSCAASFNIFKRKNRCTACQLIYCTNCFKKGQFLPERNIKHCMKCHAFKSNPYIPSELMLLSIKELKSFIEANKVSAIGCKEKQDLVDLIINHKTQQNKSNTGNMNNRSSNQGGPSSAQSIHFSPNAVNFVQSMTQDLDLDRSSSVGGDFFNSLLISTDGTGRTFQTQQQHRGGPVGFPLQPRPVWTTTGRHTTTNQTTSSSATNTPPTTSSSATNTPPTTSSSATNTPPTTSSSATNTPPTTNQTTATTNQASTSTSSSTTKTCVLKDLQNTEEIQSLSVKELKSLLDKNCVDYKGCTEKSELVQKVIRLWESAKSNDNAAKSDVDDGDRDLCKICMENLVDCVLLDCGHLVACIECGNKLKECPMCRQHIAKIVRVFKS